MSDREDASHVWFGGARSRRDAEQQADRLCRDLTALDDYGAALVRPKGDPTWLTQFERR